MIQALTLLTMALQLLVAVNNPGVPDSFRQTAISVANNAIKVAEQAIAEARNPVVPKPIPVPTPIAAPIPAPKPIKHPFEIIPVKTSNSIEFNQAGYVITIPKVFLGSFKARLDSNTQIKWYDCNISSANPKVTFGSYKLTGFVGEGDNNCFVNTGLTTTDQNGFTEEISVYLKDLDITLLDKSNSVHKLRFYLNDITVREIATDTFHRVAPLAFDLDIVRY